MPYPARSALLACLLLSAGMAVAEPLETAPALDITPEAPVTPAMSLQALTEQSDLVAIAQLRDTRYQYARSVPTKGYAELHILLPYKGSSANTFIRVYSEGLDESECYFPDEPDSAGRYLVFLNQRAETGYEGIKPWCQLPVLVASDNRYALLWPAEGLLEDELADKVESMSFSDRNAWVVPRDLTSSELSRLRSRFQMLEAEDGRLQYSQGVPSSALRALMFPPE